MDTHAQSRFHGRLRVGALTRAMRKAPRFNLDLFGELPATAIGTVSRDSCAASLA